jgi:hypothetical protein
MESRRALAFENQSFFVSCSVWEALSLLSRAWRAAGTTIWHAACREGHASDELIDGTFQEDSNNAVETEVLVQGRMRFVEPPGLEAQCLLVVA